MLHWTHSRLHSFAIYAANYWIDHAIWRDKVQSIEITESTRWQAFYLDPWAINLASSYLRSIKLINVILVTSFFDQLSTECPSLENLQLADSNLDFPEISSVIEVSGNNKLLSYNLLIRTRKLVSLCFKDTWCGYAPKHMVRTSNYSSSNPMWSFKCQENRTVSSSEAGYIR